MSDSVPNVRATMIRLPEDLYRALQAEAKRSGVSMSELCRQAIVVHLALLERMHEEHGDE